MLEQSFKKNLDKKRKCLHFGELSWEPRRLCCCLLQFVKSCSWLQETFLIFPWQAVFLRWHFNKNLFENNLPLLSLDRRDLQSRRPETHNRRVSLFRFGVSVRLVCLLLPCWGSYLLRSRCSPQWLRDLVPSGTQPSQHLMAELKEEKVSTLVNNKRGLNIKQWINQ